MLKNAHPHELVILAEKLQPAKREWGRRVRAATAKEVDTSTPSLPDTGSQPGSASAYWAAKPTADRVRVADVMRCCQQRSSVGLAVCLLHG